MPTRYEPTPRWSEDSPFRDDTIVADGRRERLLEHRRDELANMSPEIGIAYVARSARIAAALFVAVLMLGLASTAALPWLASGLAQLFPGPDPAVLSTLFSAAWIGGGLAYFLARARAERRFAQAMARAVRPTGDVHADVQRLAHVMPESLGRDMAQRHELASIAMPTIAAAVLIPCSAIYLCIALLTWGYPSPSAFDDTLTAFSPQLLASALLGMATAVVVIPRLLRLSGNRLVQFRNTAFVMLLLTIPLALWGLITSAPLAAWSGAFASAVAILSLAAAQRVRAERSQLGIAEDANVAELTFKDVLRSTRAALVALPAQLNPFTLRARLATLVAGLKQGTRAEADRPAATAFSRPAPKAAAAACAAVILGTIAYSSINPLVRNASAADPVSSIPDLDPDDSHPARPSAAGPTSVKVIDDNDDERQGLLVEIQFRDGDPAEWTLPLAQPNAGFGWHLSVSVTLEQADGAPGSTGERRLLLTPFLQDSFGDTALPITSDRPVAVFSKLVCDENLGLGLHIVPKGDWATGHHTLRLRYEPFMTLARQCEPDSH